MQFTMLKLFRRGPLQCLVLGAVLSTLLLCLWYVDFTSSPSLSPGLVEGPPEQVKGRLAETLVMGAEETTLPLPEPPRLSSHHTCPVLYPPQADIDTVDQFQKFDFEPSWIRGKFFWDSKFEERYKARRTDWSKLPLKVILLPHSHNDPGWLNTFEGYFQGQTRNILTNMATKMTALPNMTFIWTEIAFLALWWDKADSAKKEMVHKLLEEQRLEITTGGWVMTDEANSHIYAMVDQLIEGHLWLKNNLGVTVTSGWSIDPFGHGSTVPYLLKASGLSSGTVIQRIHYAWKQWLAEQQMGDFLWRQNWDKDGHTDMLVHNQPFDLYSIKHACGPHPQICLNFDFRKVIGENNEYTRTAVNIDDGNLKQKAELFLEQYGKTGSLFPHNVVLVPIGDDFRYERDLEWEQQYTNYNKIINFVNKNRDIYNTEIGFGTPKDYFKAVKERMTSLKVVKGDFFPYGDVYVAARPAYWTGYFTTRPHWKILDRTLEANLRSAEILYTFALNRMRVQGFDNAFKQLKDKYDKLTRARRHLALFQHHDAITGTSKSYVMNDYASKIMEGIEDSISIQSESAKSILLREDFSDNYERSNLIRSGPDVANSNPRLSDKTKSRISTEKNKLLVFNPLAQSRLEVVSFNIGSPNVKVVDHEGNQVYYQVDPILEKVEDPNLKFSSSQYKLTFVADLPPLTLTTFFIQNFDEPEFDYKSKVYCDKCEKPIEFQVNSMPSGSIYLENHAIKLLIDKESGFLKAMTKKSSNQTTQAEILFSSYRSAQRSSGAYLFKPDLNYKGNDNELLKDYPNRKMLIITGPITSEVRVVYGNLLTHSITIYHKIEYLSEGVYIKNDVDLNSSYKNKDKEMFMRVISDVKNGDLPEFYSDLNGFQMQKRVKIERIGIEGNYFPLNSMAYIQDAKQRLSLLVDHAQGAAAWQTGWLEVMLDRQPLYDDARGLGEGVTDSKRTSTNFWLLLEDIHKSNEFSKPSLLANYISLGLTYPPNMFLFEDNGPELNLNSRVRLISKPLPCDVHLMNLRTLADPGFTQFPSNSALMLLHRQGYACNAATEVVIPKCSVQLTASGFYPRTFFQGLKTKSIVQTTLTGLHKVSSVSSFDNVVVQPMDIVTLNVTFVD